MALRFLAAFGLIVAAPLQAAPTPDELEFFEKSIRPLLAESCYACHSSETMANAAKTCDRIDSTFLVRTSPP